MSLSAKATCVAMAVAVAAAIFLALRGAGLIAGLDFGCGQYYYTDIPGWERYFAVDHFVDTHPRALYFVLFFAWGALMYGLWRLVDRRK